jgi:hypothetical protein
LTSASKLAAWPTPTVVDRVRDEETMAKCLAFRKRNGKQNTVPLYLGEVAQMTHWPTPTLHDTHGIDQNRYSTDGIVPGRSQALMDCVQLTAWTTPSATDANRGGREVTEAMTGSSLVQQAPLASWATPTGLAPKTENYSQAGNSDGIRKIESQAQLMDSGDLPPGYIAVMKNGGVLNPAHSRWLQGCPAVWDQCSPHFKDWEAAHLKMREETELSDSRDTETH